MNEAQVASADGAELLNAQRSDEADSDKVDEEHLPSMPVMEATSVGSSASMAKAKRIVKSLPTRRKATSSAGSDDIASKSSPAKRPFTFGSEEAAEAIFDAGSENGLTSGAPTEILSDPRSASSPTRLPIRGATHKRAYQILRRIEAMAGETGDLRREIEDIRTVTHLAVMKTAAMKEILRGARKFRRVLEDNYFGMMRQDERLWDGSHSWAPPIEGEPEMDYSYNKEVSDELSSSDVVLSSDSVAEGSDPVAEDAEGSEEQEASPKAGSSKTAEPASD